ncbi:uncharacterized protein LOC128742683 [Sabethes cyaneus]|uniref:uncharacterized protein LOC128742683 n=1 Tax=Sabethes cyaneus TaxID=53552 RepID=UPI00237DDB8B|nr:uncharacterized protein LOC128742683 [Sabethes cyaneus]
MPSANLHINDLPGEVLQRIFYFVPRTSLTMVCRRWNQLAFDPVILSHLRVKFVLNETDPQKRVTKFTRPYSALAVTCHYPAAFNEKEIEQILATVEILGPSLRQFSCAGWISPARLVFALLSKFPHLERIRLGPSVEVVPNDQIPVLKNLTELELTGQLFFDVSLLAPNLRRLRANGSQYNLPQLIQTTSMQHLHLTLARCSKPMRIPTMRWMTSVTSITAVVLFGRRIRQGSLEQLCKWCPMLTKLRYNAARTSSLRCLASLKHLKTLGLENYHHDLIVDNRRSTVDDELPSVETLVLCSLQTLDWDGSMRRTFPNVTTLRLDRLDNASIVIGDGFRQLTKLELRM